MNIIILGPQGSGKGTQARLLSEKFGLYCFSMGDLVRALGEKNPGLKKELTRGTLIPDDEGFNYVREHFEEKKIFNNIIFDGFPRSMGQYKLLSSWLKEKGFGLDLALIINISESETIKRLSARRMDPETGTIYNLITNPPPSGVSADRLVVREDDKPDAIRKRLGWYRSVVVPMIENMKKEIAVYEVDGERPIEVILNDLEKIVAGHGE
ncbi:nucleoside monophosphate kinase [Candidatus Woesebacteria bacterium]|nr:nucleoside monophosphate kinase [Candidatus Woesebacteria bacterium]